MAKKDLSKKVREENDMLITKEQLRKFERASRRLVDIETGKNIKSGSGVHRTSKIDVDSRKSNTVSTGEIEEIFENSFEEYEGP